MTSASPEQPKPSLVERITRRGCFDGGCSALGTRCAQVGHCLVIPDEIDRMPMRGVMRELAAALREMPEELMAILKDSLRGSVGSFEKQVCVAVAYWIEREAQK